MQTTLEQTPILHSSELEQEYVGLVELENGDYYEIVSVTHKEHGTFLVAGSTCNTGLIPLYAMRCDGDTDETLSELLADLENLEAPSGALLNWHGSLVI
jgi:hypothetical protein